MTEISDSALSYLKHHYESGLMRSEPAEHVLSELMGNGLLTKGIGGHLITDAGHTILYKNRGK